MEDSTGVWNGTLSLKAIGRGNKGFLKGMLDEVRVWNIARTTTEISASFNTSVDPNTSGLISYWTFNGLDQVITDSSNFGNHGSLGIGSVVGTDDPVRLISMTPLVENCGGGEENIAPVANNDTADPILVGGTITIDVLANDTDIDGTINEASLLFVNPPSSGSALFDLVTGEITYTHDGSVTTSDSFIYTIEDTEGALSNEATVLIPITDFSVLSPLTDDNVVDTGFSVSGTVSDTGGIANISVFDGTNTHVASLDLVAGTWTVDLPPFVGGSDVTLTVTATDFNDNQTVSSIVVHVELLLPPIDITQARHLINRISYGITPSQLDALRSGEFDLAAYKNTQLHPAIDSGCLAPIGVGQVESNVISPFLTLPIATRNDLQNYAILMAAYNDCQLREVLTQFWDNHFSTSFDTVNNKSGGSVLQTTAWELADNNAFRANALGNFRDLVEISTKSIAMLYYLDGNINFGWNPNENFGRELMELHTMSVDGGYTDLDVVNVAKAFSGWTVVDPDSDQSTNNSYFTCNSATHDYSDIVLDLGDGIGANTITTAEPHDASSCEFSGLAVIDRLVNLSVTGEFICQKLTELLVSDKKTLTVVNVCKTVYANSIADSDQIAQMVAAILNTDEFKNNDDYLDKVKTPLELEVGYLRNFDIVNSDAVPLSGALSSLSNELNQMSMFLFRFGTPDGFPEQSVDWLNSGRMLQRLAFISDVTFNTKPIFDIYLDPTAFFAEHVSTSTAVEIVDYLIDLALQNQNTILERNTALGILNNTNGFDGSSNDFDTETDANIKQNRLRALLAVVLNYPGYQYQ